MKSITGMHNCYGCGVCAAACPFEAVTMQWNRNGFLEPVVDPSLCRNCSVCVSVCSYLENQHGAEAAPIKALYGWSSDPQIRQTSSSGGICFEILAHLIEQGYRACVVQYNQSAKRAEHYIAETREQLYASQGSKYIQSCTLPAFRTLAEKGKFVVVGTPCQIDSIRRWIKKKNREEDFILVDFFCHGVPSDALWQSYVRIQERRHGKLSDICWRSKKKQGWQESWVMNFSSEKHGQVFYPRNKDIFYPYFLGNLNLNAACYDHCKYKWDQSSADIRLGDFWGTDLSVEEAGNGVSSVLVMNQRGQAVMQALQSRICCKEIEPEFAMKGQMRTAPRRRKLVFMVSYLVKSPTALLIMHAIRAFGLRVKRLLKKRI